MGWGLKAECSCGYHTSVLVGSGMLGPRPDYSPGVCRRCSEVVAVDVSAEEWRCGRCGGAVEVYGASAAEWRHPPLRESPDDPERIVFPQAKGVFRTGVKYLCPKCGQAALTFRDGTMLWD